MDLDMTVPQDSSPHPAFRIWLCGAFRLERYEKGEYQSIRTSEWGGSSYPRLLLKALLCCPGRQARREALLEMLWPESELEQAIHYINTATTKLRTVLRSAKGQESVLITENDATFYRLEGQALLWVDADAALALLKEAEQQGRTRPEVLPWLEQAGAYFGAGLFLQEEEGQWVTGRRATIEQACYRARLWLAEAYEQQGMPGQAATVLSALLEEDGLDEDVLCRLMSLLHQQGMTHQALRLYERMGTVFAGEQVEFTEAAKSLAARLQEERHHLVRDLPMIEEAPITLRENTSLQRNGEPIPASSLAHMVQFTQTTVHKTLFAEQGGLVPSESGMWLPLALSVQTSSLETTSLDLATWFGVRVNDLKALGTFQHELTLSCQQQQAFIHAELETWSKMANDNHQPINEHLISRRMALATLAMLSTSLLAKVQFGKVTAIVIEEFLAESTTSIVACWHLLRGDGLATVEHALPKYLPLLLALIKQYPSYKTKASYLASQGFLLLSLVALHRLHFSERVAYCKKAVEFARESEDRTLLVASLMHLGDAFFTNGQKVEMLHTYFQAEYQSKSSEISMFLRSKVLAELAHAYAQHGKDQEALRSVGEARAIFTEESSDTPVFLSTDYGLFQLILFEGLSAIDLGNYEETQKNSCRAQEYYQNASDKLNQIEHLSQTIIVPERIRVEIVNQRALAAAMAGNLDEFEKYLIEGAQGAKALASEKRRQEAITNWKEGRDRWPHEKRVMELADMLF